MGKSERPQPGNPHRLTLRQHVLPRKSIERFCNHAGRVNVRLLEKSVDLSLDPRDPIFCAKRVWDQRAESVVGAPIEARFQSIADALANGTLASVPPESQVAVTEMYLLWRNRSLLVANPVPDYVPRGVTPCDLTPDQQERLEKAGVAFVRPDGKYSSRILTGFRLQFAMDSDWLAGASSMRWGVLRCPSGLELITPDQSTRQPLLPIAPGLCLAAGVPDQGLDLSRVIELNRVARASAQRYWFARDPSRCPS